MQLLDRRLTKKAAFAAFFLSLFFACSGSRGCWQYSEICGDCYCAAHVVYSPQKCTLATIEVEFVRCSTGLRVYLNLHACPIAGCKEDPCCAEISMTIDDIAKKYSVYKFEGGQRLLLSPEATFALTDALANDKCVTIEIGFYKSVVEASNFCEVYDLL